MTARLNKWLRQMYSPMRSMTELLETIAAISLPNPSLSAHLPRIQTLYQTLAATSTSDLACKDQLGIVTQLEFAPFVTHFTALLTALIPQLNKLGSRLSIAATSIGTAEEEVFWGLWRFLLAGCSLFGSAFGRDVILTDLQPFDANLYAAFDALLKWVLSISRTPAWLAMQSQHGLLDRNGELLVILAQPLNSLLRLGAIESVTLQVSHLSCFPPTTLPLLCCIMSETFTDAPAVVPLPHPLAWQAATTYKQGIGETHLATNLAPFLNMLVAAINNLASNYKISGHSGVLSFLTAPAVVHFLKVTLIVTRSSLPSSSYDIVPLSLACLDCMMDLCDRDIHTTPGVLLSASDARCNKDAVGLPLHLNPRISREVLETDVRLLHAVTQHLSVNAGLMKACFCIQALTLRNWMLAGRLYPISTETLAVMVKSVVGIAKLCTSHGLRMLQHLQRLQKLQQLQQLQQDMAYQLEHQDAGPVVRDESNLDLGSAVTAPSSEKDAAPGLQVLRLMRTLFHLASNFTITLQAAQHSYNLHPTTGE